MAVDAPASAGNHHSDIPIRAAARYRRILDQLATVGVDFEDVTEQLESEGLANFEKSWHELSHTIAAELHRNHPARQS